jgi:2-polyprenyl-3-methyl-5-hydroxy-6-metoxy-1,4-benzoquinol methylase
MKNQSEFYQELHQAERTYSAGTYYMPAFWNEGAITRWCRGQAGKSVRLLDVGCGKGLFLRDLARGFQERGMKCTVTGLDLVRSPDDLFHEIPNFNFLEQNTDGNPLPFSNESFDFITCNHVLEHIFETENLLKEFTRVLSPVGLCVVSVPNLAAWINRVTFLFAGQPLGSELGTESVAYGYWPRSLQKKLEPFRPSGHIRDFTPRGLEDICARAGLKRVGWWAQSHGPIARLGKWAGRNVGIVLQKA